MRNDTGRESLLDVNTSSVDLFYVQVIEGLLELLHGDLTAHKVL